MLVEDGDAEGNAGGHAGGDAGGDAVGDEAAGDGDGGFAGGDAGGDADGNAGGDAGDDAGGGSRWLMFRWCEVWVAEAPRSSSGSTCCPGPWLHVHGVWPPPSCSG